MRNVTHLFNIIHGIYFNQTFIRKKIKKFFNEQMEKFLYPIHPLRCIITGPSESEKGFLLTN